MSYNTFEDDTRLVMTILFVGAVSGVNVYFFATFGSAFLSVYGPYTLAVLFGVLTVGGIMILKSVFDLVLNEYIEDFLLQRSIIGLGRPRTKRTAREFVSPCVSMKSSGSGQQFNSHSSLSMRT